MTAGSSPRILPSQPASAVSEVALAIAARDAAIPEDLKIKVTLLPVNELAPDGRTVLLTHLCEGQAATVLQPPAQPATAAEVDAQKRVTYVG